MGTVELTFSQWSLCVGIATSLVVVEEVLKFFLRRRGAPAVDHPMEAMPVDTPAASIASVQSSE